MATSGRGAFPLISAWGFKRGLRGQSTTSLLYRQLSFGDTGQTTSLIWNDWFFGNALETLFTDSDIDNGDDDTWLSFYAQDDSISAAVVPDDYLSFSLLEYPQELEEDVSQLSSFWQVDDDGVAAVADLPVTLDAEIDATFGDDFLLSFYAVSDDDIAVAVDTVSTDFDFPVEDFSDAESFYFQLDDDFIAPLDAVSVDFSASIDADFADDSFSTDYAQLDDDAALLPGADPVFAFELQDEVSLGEEFSTDYVRFDDDAVVPVPPGFSNSGGGGGGRVSFDEVDRLRKQARQLEKHRRVRWKDKKEFDQKIEQIYQDLYETPYQAEAQELAATISTESVQPLTFAIDHGLLLANLSSVQRLLDIYQFYCDDEEAATLLLIL